MQNDISLDFAGVHPYTLLCLVESCSDTLQSLNIAGLRFEDIIVNGAPCSPEVYFLRLFDIAQS